MEILGVLVVLIIMVIILLLAIKFGVQWAILGNLPFIKSYLKGENNEKLEKSDESKQKIWTNLSFSNLLSSSFVRLLFIGIICLTALIPIEILTDLAYERSRSADYAVARVAKSWGEKQNVRGPAIWLPYKELTTYEEIKKDKNGNKMTTNKEVWTDKYRMFLPDDLEITADIKTQTRKSGIYPVPVYTANMNIKGRLPKLINENVTYKDNIRIFTIGIKDTKGLKKVSSLWIKNEAGEEKKIEALSGLTNIISKGRGKGLHYLIPKICAQSSCDFSFDIELNGVQSIDFSTTGKETKLNINANWPHPKFYGQGLPDKKEITEQSFKANWHVGNLVRSYAQMSDSNIASMKQFDEYILGVDLIQPVNPYSMVLRSVKYGLLLIGLTLIGMFVFEQIINKRLHIVQYLVTVGALSLFYLTLLSLSEHIGFLNSWIAASVIIILMVCSYVSAALKAVKPAIGLAVFMGAVYTIMYALLRLEDYALLVGTFILLIFMIIVMRVTRKLNHK